MYDFDFEFYDLSVLELRELIYEEIMLYYSEEERVNYETNKLKYPNGMLHLRLQEKPAFEEMKD